MYAYRAKSVRSGAGAAPGLRVSVTISSAAAARWVQRSIAASRSGTGCVERHCRYWAPGVARAFALPPRRLPRAGSAVRPLGQPRPQRQYSSDIRQIPAVSSQNRAVEHFEQREFAVAVDPAWKIDPGEGVQNFRAD